MAKSTLSMMEKKFVEAYDGDGQSAAIAAGYSPKSARSMASQLLGREHVIRAIWQRAKRENNKLIANRQERQEFWSTIMRRQLEDTKDRLKASELLGRSEADFTDKLLVQNPMVILKDLTGE